MIPLPPDYSCPVLLGSGKFSSVYRVYQAKLDRMAAIKVFNLHKKDVINKIFAEVNMLNSVSLTCVPHVYDVQYSKYGPMIVMQWIKGISIDRFFSINPDRSLKFTAAGKLLNSLSELHKVNITHGDLKPDNVIMSTNGTACFVDFGFASKTVRQAFRTDEIRGTPHYMAPELWSYEKNIDLKKCDVYAMGKMLQEILGSEFPEKFRSSVDNNPDKRPVCGSEMLSIWNELYTDDNVTFETRLTVAVASATSSNLISKYIDAVNSLILKKRYTEAYQIVTDILDESPDNAYALTMLKSMNLTKKKKKPSKLLISASAAAVAVLLFIIAFELGRNSDAAGTLPESSVNIDIQKDTLLHIGQAEKNIIEKSPAEFRDVSADPLPDGEVRCTVPVSRGTLIVDEKEKSTNATKGENAAVCTLSQGTHTFQWVDSTADMVFIETVELLPFEKKQIRIGFAK